MRGEVCSCVDTSPTSMGLGRNMRLYMIRSTTSWRHQMEEFSALLDFCAGNSPVTSEFPAQRPVTRSFDVFFDLRLNQQLIKQWTGDLRLHLAHYDIIIMNNSIMGMIKRRKYCNGYAVILTKLSSLAAPEAVKYHATSCAANDEDFVKMTTFPFQCMKAIWFIDDPWNHWPYDTQLP